MRILLSCLLVVALFRTTPVSAQLNLELIGHLPYAPLGLSGCWHYVDSTGGEWALVGTTAGLSLVDLRNPKQPVERFSVPSLENNWREVKTWNGFAYFGSEAPGSGITIVDLRQLPDTIAWKVWLGDGVYDGKVQRSHTVQAQDGYLYIFGGYDITTGAVIADLTDPWEPHIIGKYTLRYVHDGFIRGDTLWASEVYEGQFSAIDISDKTDPQFIASQPTPGKFNHNTGLSDDSKIIFTTDEKSNAPLAAFDVSDLDAPRLLDTYYPSQKPSFEVHNVRVFKDFLVNPSYGGQLTIVDAHRPDNLIETAWAVVGNSLVWDADPYLPSGLVFATAKQEGFFVFKPTYQRASYLEGMITDAVSGQELLNADVVVSGTTEHDSSDISGNYKTGAALPGTYTVEVSKDGYEPRTIPGVILKAGEVTVLHVALTPMPTSTDTPETLDFQVFPTVFTDRLTVQANNALPVSATLRLTDAQGKTLREMSFEGFTATWTDLAGLPAGTYFVSSVHKNGARQVAQVLKK